MFPGSCLHLYGSGGGPGSPSLSLASFSPPGSFFGIMLRFLQVVLLQTGRLQHPESHTPAVLDPQVLMALLSVRLRLSTFWGLGVPTAGLARGRGPSLSFICATETP